MRLRKFTWNDKRLEAVALVADDVLKDDEIATRLGITRMQLYNWKQHPVFQAAVTEHTEAVRAAIRAEGIASKQNRLDAYNEDWNRLEALIQARAASPLMQGVDGGSTGLLVAEPMIVKVYEADAGDADDDDAPLKPLKETRIVYTYSYDDAVLKRRQDLAKQAAQELGQWVEKSESRNEHAILGLVGIRVEDI